MDPAWDRTDPRPVRREKYAESLERLPARQYAPFAPRALTSIYPPDLCIGYPAPDRFVPAVRPGATSDVPALLLSGELDPTTPASLAGGVRRVLTAAEQVRIAGAGHTTVYAGPCSVQIAVRVPAHAGDRGHELRRDPELPVPGLVGLPAAGARRAPGRCPAGESGAAARPAGRDGRRSHGSGCVAVEPPDPRRCRRGPRSPRRDVQLRLHGLRSRGGAAGPGPVRPRRRGLRPVDAGVRLRRADVRGAGAGATRP